MYEYNPLTVPSIELIQEQQADAEAENPIMELDLETVEYYFALCVECKRFTKDFAEASDCIHYVKENEWQLIDSMTYCPECADVVRQRQGEEEDYASF